MRINRIADDMVMATEQGCTCVFTFGVDPRNGEAIVVGGRNCERWPACRFPVHTAMDLAQEEFDRDSVRPNYKLLEAFPEP